MVGGLLACWLAGWGHGSMTKVWQVGGRIVVDDLVLCILPWYVGPCPAPGPPGSAAPHAPAAADAAA